MKEIFLTNSDLVSIGLGDLVEDKPWLFFEYPKDEKQLAKLSYDQKMEWYSTRDPKTMVWLGNDPDFQRFWKWNVLFPLKLKRFYYRVKNLEIFKKYTHITEMKKKAKHYSI